MKNPSIYLYACIFSLYLLTASDSFSQGNEVAGAMPTLQSVQKKYGLDPEKPLTQRVDKTPDDVIKLFKDAGMSPAEHPLTEEESRILAAAVKALPPLHQRVLKQHLRSISFLDNMPNTALTSPITNKENIKLYHITFRAGILHQNISEWATEKERSCFSGGDSTISISVQAGLLSALTYVLLHEGTHVVDGSMRLIAADTLAGKPGPNIFTSGFSNGIWRNRITHEWSFRDSIVVKNRFRPGGRRYRSTEALQVYEALARTPFVSLYSTSSWHEDLAELVTVYHLTKVYKQPFQILVKQSGTVLQKYDPMKSSYVQKRLKMLRLFYEQT